MKSTDCTWFWVLNRLSLKMFENENNYRENPIYKKLIFTLNSIGFVFYYVRSDPE